MKLVTPSMSVRTENPISATINHMKVRSLAHAFRRGAANAHHFFQTSNFASFFVICVCISMYHNYDTFMHKINTIERRIKAIKEELMSLDDMRPGSLTVQTRSWGGEYHQLSFSHKGKGRTQYVKEENVETVKKQIANYKRFRELTKEWVDLALQAAILREKK